MSKNRPNLPAKMRHVLPHRQGEGVAVESNLTIEGDKKTLAVGLGMAPVPDRRYVADAYFVTENRRVLKVMFGQLKTSGQALRSLLIIHMTSQGLANFLLGVDQLSPSVDEIARIDDIAVETTDIPLEEPPQTVALSANMGIVGVSNLESCVDFYQASPFAVSAALAGRELAIDPVVRVELSTSLFLGLVGRLKNIRDAHYSEAGHDRL